MLKKNKGRCGDKLKRLLIGLCVDWLFGEYPWTILFIVPIVEGECRLKKILWENSIFQ